MTDIAPRDLTKADATDLVGRINAAMSTVVASGREVAILLRKARERNAPAALGYATWDEFVETEFGMSRSNGYRYLELDAVARELEAAVGLSDDVPLRDISQREAEKLAPDLGKHVKAVRAAASDLPPDVPPEERAAVVRETLNRRAKDPRVEKPAKPPIPVVDEAPGTVAPAVQEQAASVPVGAGAPLEPLRVLWKDLLGPDLAGKVAKVAPDDPAGFCVDAVRKAVTEGKRRKAEAAKVKPRCAHTGKRSPNGRCHDCGATGIGTLAPPFQSPPSPAKKRGR